MEVYRISEKQFSTKLMASGKAGRWNESNQYVLYVSSSRALATLEALVNFNGIAPGGIQKIMVISFSDESHLLHTVADTDLPDNWRSNVSYSGLRRIGSEWYSSAQSLILRVPSAIVPKEYNFLINTQHPHFKKKIKLLRTEDYFWDERLLP